MSTEFCNNFGKYCDLKLMKTDIRRNYVRSKPNYHITEQIFENCLEKKQQNFLNGAFYSYQDLYQVN